MCSFIMTLLPVMSLPSLGATPDLLVLSGTNQILRYDGTTGQFIGVFAEGPTMVVMPQFGRRIKYGPNNRLYVSGMNYMSSWGVERLHGQTGELEPLLFPGTCRHTSMVFEPELNSGVMGACVTNENAALYAYDLTNGSFTWPPAAAVTHASAEMKDILFVPGEAYYWQFGGGYGIRAFDPQNGDYLYRFAQENDGESMLIGCDGLIYTSTAPDQVSRFDRLSGDLIDVFIEEQALDVAAGMILAPNGDFLISSRNTHQVLRFNGETGDLIGVFAEGGELFEPTGLTFMETIRGDTDCDGDVDFDDVTAFAAAIVAPEEYRLGYPECAVPSADVNGDGNSDGDDIGPFVEALVSGGFDPRLPCPGDVDCDDQLDSVLDRAAFIQALLDPESYGPAYVCCDVERADVNGDSSIDGRDIASFVTAHLSQACP